MIPLKNNSNVDLSDLTNYPDGRVKDNDGSGNGTPVNRSVYGDLHTNISKLMRLYEITPNELPDNETNGYQIIEALKALASKNDYIYPLLTNGTTTLNIDIKLSLMKDNEFITCLASADKTTENLIKGSGSSTFAITYSGNFKANEYVRVVKTSGGVSIIRLADWNSLEAMVSELGFLKAASGSETIAGIISNKAVTPVSFLAAFAEYVIGATSANFLATSLRNGLYPKAHFAIVAAIGANPVKNVGWFSGLDIGGSAGPLPFNGDFGSVIASNNGSGHTKIQINLNNEMDSLNYYVRTYLESEGVMSQDDRVANPVFRPITTNSLEIGFAETSSIFQSLKVHIEVVQL